MNIANYLKKQIIFAGLKLFGMMIISSVDLGLTVQSLLGLLDSPARKDVIKLGVPLQG